jgi:hypothetical protein
MMSDLLSIQRSSARYVLVGMTILLLLAVFPLAAAAEHRSSVSYSGDDAYDPAAGGLGVLSAVAGSEGKVASYSLSGSAIAGGYSGDDAYDPAAGGLPALSAGAVIASQSDVADCDPTGFEVVGRYSGDDAYDPAAGGILYGSPLALACLPSAIGTP